MRSTPSAPTSAAVAAGAVTSTDEVREVCVSPELQAELRQAIADIESGNCLQLTPQQLKELAATGELRVLDEWLAESPD
jgi:hypothetical protein